MMLSDAYWMTARWGARVEAPEILAERFLRCVDAIQPLHPLLDQWEWADIPKFLETEGAGGIYSFAEIRKKFIPAIERNAGTGDEGEPDPYYGYHLTVMKDGKSLGKSVALSASAGEGVAGGSWVSPFINDASFRLRPASDPSLVDYALLRSIFLLINETWEATWAEASPGDIDAYWTGFPVRCAWMSYVSPRFAPLMTPPASAIVEHRPNGGLFLAATRDVFETANPAHIAVAREIEAALQPLNLIPNPNDAPYR